MENFSFSVLKKILVPGFFIGIASIIFAMFFFFSQWGYSESGHTALLYIYILLSLIMMLTLHYKKSGATMLVMISLIAILCYAYAKFDWRRDYIKQANQGITPAIQRHIDQYPTYEEHVFSGLIGSPKWIAFSRECLEPALSNIRMNPDCNSANLIQDNYNIDINATINNYYAKMRKTALRLQNGEFQNKNIYRRCLQSGACAYIPLLPPEAQPEKITPNSDEYIGIRRQFWSIINNKTIQNDACDFMDLCRMMRNAKVITIQDN